MPADLSMRGGQDRRRIDVSQEHELQDWSEKFGVKRERLREAVKAVGDRADAVKEHLAAANQAVTVSAVAAARGKAAAAAVSERSSSEAPAPRLDELAPH